MEAQRAQNAREGVPKTRSDSERVSPSYAGGENSAGASRDPIYPSQSPSQPRSQVEESIEGFRATGSKDAGMSNLEMTENFGARFQMPEPESVERFRANKPDDSRINEGAYLKSLEPVDIQASVLAIQDLIHKIRANLESPEQGELEELLRQGAEILQQNWLQLSQFATQQASEVKQGIRENPYRSVVTAMKLGMAISQIYGAHRASVEKAD